MPWAMEEGGREIEGLRGERIGEAEIGEREMKKNGQVVLNVQLNMLYFHPLDHLHDPLVGLRLLTTFVRTVLT